MDRTQQLIRAAKENKLVRVEDLLKKGTSPDSRDQDGFTPLYWACCKGHLDVCRRLLCWGCDVNAKGKTRATPLMACVDNGHTNCLTLLLQHRCILVNERSDRGDTALHMAAFRGFPQIVTMLCEAGADSRLQNVNNQTPLGEAFINDRTECARILNLLAQKSQKSLNGSRPATNGNAHKSDSSQSGFPADSSTPRPDSVGFVSSDSAVGPSLQSSIMSSHSISRVPECVDDRLPVATTRVSQHSHHDTTNATLVNHNHAGRRLSSSSDLESMDCVGSGSHCYIPPRVGNDSMIDSLGSNPSGTYYHYTNGNTHITQPPSTSSSYMLGPYSPSIDSQYQSSPSYLTSFDDVSGPPAFCYAPTIQHSHATTSVSHMNQNNSLYKPVSCVNKRKSCANNLTLKIGNPEAPESTVDRMNIPCDANDANERDKQTPSGIWSNGRSADKLSTTKKRYVTSKDDVGSPEVGSEMLPGLKMSSFVENLQMRVLMLEESLNQERASKSELRKENNHLKEENIRLKTSIRNMVLQYSEKSSKG